jgi:hypothetical protein
MLGLYERMICVGYHDDPGGADYEVLLAIDDDADRLVLRWNRKQDAEREALIADGQHFSYVNAVPPHFKKGTQELEYSGSAGGGWSRVTHTLTIRKVKQFDDPA